MLGCVCDRCGKGYLYKNNEVVQNPKIGDQTFTFNGVTLAVLYRKQVGFGDTSFGHIYQNTFDLCPDCRVEFVEFMDKYDTFHNFSSEELGENL